MKASDLRDRHTTDDELARALEEKRQELFNLRFQHATGALENTGALAAVKRDIARLMTISHERADAAGKVESQ